MKISALIGEHNFDVQVDRDDGHFVVKVGDRTHRVDARKLEGDFYSILDGQESYEVGVERVGDGYKVRRGASVVTVNFVDPSRSGRAKLAKSGPEQIVTHMPGRVVRILVAEGDKVEAGQGVIVVEAMKMENEISTDKGGTVKSVVVEEGQSVDGGAELLVIE